MSQQEEVAALKEKYAEKRKELSDEELKGWLALDSWTMEEGLLLIVGIDPKAAVVEWGGWVSALGCRINKVRLLNARLLSKHPLYLAIPSPKLPHISDEGHPGEFAVSWDVLPDKQEEKVKWDKLTTLQELEEQLSRIHRLWISGQHSEQRYPAAYFLGWAEKKHIEIPWLSHAREMEWLPVGIKSATANRSLDSVPGKMPRTAIGKLAIKAAWMIEGETKRAATATQVMTHLQVWADDGTEPGTLLKSDKQKRAVIWVTAKTKPKSFDTDACGKALETWLKSRA